MLNYIIKWFYPLILRTGNHRTETRTAIQLGSATDKHLKPQEQKIQFLFFHSRKLENAFPAENSVSAVVQSFTHFNQLCACDSRHLLTNSWMESYFLV